MPNSLLAFVKSIDSIVKLNLASAKFNSTIAKFNFIDFSYIITLSVYNILQ